MVFPGRVPTGSPLTASSNRGAPPVFRTPDFVLVNEIDREFQPRVQVASVVEVRRVKRRAPFTVADLSLTSENLYTCRLERLV